MNHITTYIFLRSYILPDKNFKRTLGDIICIHEPSRNIFSIWQAAGENKLYNLSNNKA
jgi:hypothetical protein